MKRKAKKKLHSTEQKYPKQCAEYKKIWQELYQLHLDKNREYSPNNIKMLGTLGLSLRMMEKNIRTLNILGWDPFEGQPKESLKSIKFDSVEQELLDIANIAIIALVLGKGKWGQ